MTQRFKIGVLLALATAVGLLGALSLHSTNVSAAPLTISLAAAPGSGTATYSDDAGVTSGAFLTVVGGTLTACSVTDTGGTPGTLSFAAGGTTCSVAEDADTIAETATISFTVTCTTATGVAASLTHGTTISSTAVFCNAGINSCFGLGSTFGTLGCNQCGFDPTFGGLGSFGTFGTFGSLGNFGNLGCNQCSTFGTVNCANNCATNFNTFGNTFGGFSTFGVGNFGNFGCTAATVSLTATPILSCTGTSTVTATVRDQFGNAVPNGTLVSFSGSGIGASSGSTTGGVATTTVTATATTSQSTIVTATSGGVSGNTTVQISCAPTPPPAPVAPISIAQIPTAGLVRPPSTGDAGLAGTGNDWLMWAGILLASGGVFAATMLAPVRRK